MSDKAMELKELQINWDKFGRTDPLWAILSEPECKGNRWKVAEFFATGEKEVEAIVEYVHSLGRELPRGAALDFGCGIGRVTQPLARHFDLCYGIDIAPSMIALAQQYNQWGERCRYILNEQSNLSIFPDESIQFVYSAITLQNIAPRYSRVYIREFVRILAPGGLLLFQIPSRPRKIRQRIKQFLPYALLGAFYKVKYRGRPVMEIHGLPKEEVIALLTGAGATILAIEPDQRTFGEWDSFRYCATK